MSDLPNQPASDSSHSGENNSTESLDDFLSRRPTLNPSLDPELYERPHNWKDAPAEGGGEDEYLLDPCREPWRLAPYESNSIRHGDRIFGEWMGLARGSWSLLDFMRYWPDQLWNELLWYEDDRAAYKLKRSEFAHESVRMQREIFGHLVRLVENGEIEIGGLSFRDGDQPPGPVIPLPALKSIDSVDLSDGVLKGPGFHFEKCCVRRVLGAVDIQRNAMAELARCTMALKLTSVLS